MVLQEHIRCCLMAAIEEEQGNDAHHEVSNARGVAHEDPIGHGYRVTEEHQDLKEDHHAEDREGVEIDDNVLPGLNRLHELRVLALLRGDHLLTLLFSGLLALARAGTAERLIVGTATRCEV